MEAMLWHEHVWLPVEALVGEVTADRSSGMNSEVYRAIFSAHIQPNAP